VDEREAAVLVNRAMVEYSDEWEGFSEDVRPCGEGIARGNGVSGFAFARFTGADLDGRLDRAIEELESGGRQYAWIAGPLTEPRDLAGRLERRGFRCGAIWDGLILEDLDVPIEVNPGVTVEQPTGETAAEIAAIRAPNGDGAHVREALADAVRRYVQTEPKGSLILVGRLDGRLVTYTSTRFDPDGTAYLRQGSTHPDAQGHGVYTTLLAHRLRAAREAGCRRAVVQAITATSSQILRRYGFRRVCGFTGWGRWEPQDSVG
jgi:GNAT superfamily N-acetyltransferase